MRLMGMRVEEIIEPLRDIRCDRCIVEGRFPERQWSREVSIDRDDIRKPTEELTQIGEGLPREVSATKGVQKFDDLSLTKLLNANGATIICQLWEEG